MKLLVPVDGSECAQRAVAYAINRVRQSAAPDQCELHVLNVQLPVTGRAASFVNAQDLKEYHREEGTKAIAPARDLLAAASIDARVHIDVGTPADVISRYAQDLQADEIVMGTRGHGNITDMILGSTSEEVLSATSLPVVLVR